MDDKEKQIASQIKTINEMIYAICEELNNYKDIDDYEIELSEESYKTCIDNKYTKHYKLLVTCKRNL